MDGHVHDPAALLTGIEPFYPLERKEAA